jgi:hypothetical protein
MNRRKIALVVIAAASCIHPLLAQESPGEAPPATNKAPKEPTTLRELIDATVDEIQVFADAEAAEPARALVVMRWANNARGSEDGTTALFVHEGRPLAVACFYPWEGQLGHDFSATCRQRIVARRDGTVIWQPQEPGIKFAEIPDAPPPAKGPAQRLRQMKSLAEQFSSTMLGWKADSTDREELRLLPRPLYRYEPTSGPLVDGAMFAFVMGTDPESLLLIEAVKQGDAAQWQYAFVRRTSGELEGRHRGKVVWQAERFPDTHDPRKPDFSFGLPIPPELLPPNDKP